MQSLFCREFQSFEKEQVSLCVGVWEREWDGERKRKNEIMKKNMRCKKTKGRNKKKVSVCVCLCVLLREREW